MKKEHHALLEAATPGPWHIRRKTGINGAHIVGGDGTIVARITMKADKPIHQKEADAELIVRAVNKNLGYCDPAPIEGDSKP